MIWNFVKEYGKELMIILNSISPYLLLGFFFAGVLHVYIQQDKIAKYTGKANFLSVLRAAFLGVPLPLCSCGVIPTGVSMYKEGSSKGSTVAFLISTPQTGIDSIFITGSMLGWPFAILRPIFAFLSGIFGGALTNQFDKTPNPNANIEKKITPILPESFTQKIKGLLQYGYLVILQDIAKWLIIGILASALISVLVPADFFTKYLGNTYQEMLLMLLVSTPLYVCATGSVPIVAVLIMKGLSPGAAFVFLMAGPATNLATLTVLFKALGKKTAFLYLISIIISALLSGIIINELFDKSFLLGGISPHSMHHHEHGTGNWFEYVSSFVFVALLLNALVHKYIQSYKIKFTPIHLNMETIKIQVNGMECNHCKMNVEKNLKTLDGIDEIIADPNTSSVVISGKAIDLDKIKEKVESIGYKYNGIMP